MVILIIKNEKNNG